MRHRKVLPLLLLLFLAPAVTGASFAVLEQADWEDGTFSGTEASNGVLQLQDGESSGTYTSRTFDAGDNYTWESLEVNAALNGGSATATVETSHDEFSSVNERETFGASGGVETFDVSSLDETRYVRFNYTLTGDAEVDATNVTIGDPSSFIIREGSCQADERELFSMDRRTNAHAGDPGHWGYSVCATGFDQRHFTQVCTSDETEILSFFGSEQTTTHLATDPDLFDYKLCTETLTVGVRDTCPDTTKALVSIFEESESHVAEPGHYPKQLCGSFFDSVTAMLRFHLGPNTTVRINRTEDPSQGIYRDLDGRDSWYVTAENGTVVTGIVSGEDTVTTAVGYDERDGDTVFNMSQERGQAGFLFPFTTGSAGDVEDRITLIESGTFMSQFNPNFGFTLANVMTIRLTLRLTEIDLISDLALSPGPHSIVIENVGETSDGVPKVGVNVTR